MGRVSKARMLNVTSEASPRGFEALATTEHGDADDMSTDNSLPERFTRFEASDPSSAKPCAW